MEKKTEPRYKKVGKRYVPVGAAWYEDCHDSMQAGTFRLTYAYKDGGKRYEYDVTPATAPTAAAMLIAKVAIEQAIVEASKMRPSSPVPYTKKQLEIIEKFRQDMGGMMPTWWTENSAYEIADAAIEAVKNFRP
jgi:hypothetical protein